MGFRFFRRMKIAPGVSLNFSRSGISPSFGAPGARVTVGRSGIRKTVGVPGTGMYYTTVDRGGRGRRRSRRRSEGRAAPPAMEHDLDLGFFERLFTPKHERAFVDGCKAYLSGDRREALREFAQADGLADAHYLAGMLALDAERLEQAETSLREALRRHRSLGKLFEKYNIASRVALPITEHVVAYMEPARTGAMLALAEVYQLQERINDAVACLERVLKDAPDDPVVRLSLAELLLEAKPNDRRTAKRVVRLIGDVKNESEIHAAMMLFKAQALRALGLPAAARSELTAAKRKKKDRSPELLRAIQYERGLAYEDLGQNGRAKRDFGAVFAEDPDYEDVAQRIDL